VNIVLIRFFVDIVKNEVHYLVRHDALSLVKELVWLAQRR
jgi:hypothetical protein